MQYQYKQSVAEEDKYMFLNKGMQCILCKTEILRIIHYLSLGRNYIKNGWLINFVRLNLEDCCGSCRIRRHYEVMYIKV